MRRLIVFDWDGTLADSVNKIIECKHFLARKYDLPIPDRTVIRGVLGTPFEQAMRQCFPTASESLLETLCREFHLLMQLPQYQAELFPKAKELLSTLKAQGLKLAVATSKNRKELDSALEHTQLVGVFEITCCGAEHREKPDPAMLHYIMQMLKVQQDECLMVGDTVTDIFFAANAGVPAVCVTFGSQSAEKLTTANPLTLIDNFFELPPIIDGLAMEREGTPVHLV